MNVLVPVLPTGLSLLGATASLKMHSRASLSKDLTSYRLTFPRGLELEAVQDFVSGLSSLLLPAWKRWLASPFVVVETRSSARGISHSLTVPAAWASLVENVLQASVPSVRYGAIDTPALTPQVAAEYRLSTGQRALRVDSAALSAKLITSLQPLSDGEQVWVQWIVTPHSPVPPVRVANGKDGLVFDSINTVVDSEAAAALRKKQASALLLAVGRIGVSARSNARCRQLLRNVEAAWHESRAPGVHLRRRAFSESAAARRMIKRTVPFAEWPGVYNSEELSGLIGWPVEATAIPGLVLGSSRLVAASPLIPKTGTVVADSLFPGDKRPLALDVDARLRHLHLLGPTGTGKSTLIVNMVLQDLQNGSGVLVLDPKGDMVRDILERIPSHRRNDIIVLDPADTDRPVGFNPLHAEDEDQVEVVVENLVGLFRSLYRQSWGPRLDDILRAACLTLASTGSATLCEVPLLLTDASYRRRLVSKLDDPVGLESFWGWYESISDAERALALGPVMNKVRAFTMRSRIRSIIGQAEPKLRLADVMRSGKVVLVSLATGLLGDEAAALMGALIIAELWHATTARAGLPATERRSFMAYLDEWQHFLHLPTPMASVLAEARGLGLGLTLAHQHIGQLPEETRHAVLANARSRIVWQLPADDARLVSRVMGGVFSDQDLEGLGQFEVVTQLHAAGNTQPPATGKTRPLPKPSSDAAEIRSWSRQCYGVDRRDVEAGIRFRQFGKADNRVGRSPRRGRGGGNGRAS